MLILAVRPYPSPAPVDNHTACAGVPPNPAAVFARCMSKMCEFCHFEYRRGTGLFVMSLSVACQGVCFSAVGAIPLPSSDLPMVSRKYRGIPIVFAHFRWNSGNSCPQKAQFPVAFACFWAPPQTHTFVLDPDTFLTETQRSWLTFPGING